MKLIRHGVGTLVDPDLPEQKWGGRKAQQYTRLTLAEYGTICWLCGLPGATSADHVIPRSKGGAVYDLANLAPSHSKCNYSRGNRDPTSPSLVIESGLDFFEEA